MPCGDHCRPSFCIPARLEGSRRSIHFFNNFIFRLYFLRENAETESDKIVGVGPTFPSKNAAAERRELAEQLKQQHVFIEEFRKCPFVRVLGSDLAAKEDHIIHLFYMKRFVFSCFSANKSQCANRRNTGIRHVLRALGHFFPLRKREWEIDRTPDISSN